MQSDQPPHALGPGSFTPGLHTVKELRGCMNHGACTGRFWQWAVGPPNQLLTMADINQIWIRRNDPSIWSAFRSVVRFMRDVMRGESIWGGGVRGNFPRFTRCTQRSSLAGTRSYYHMALGGLRPTCIGVVRWGNREYFAEDDTPFPHPFRPVMRDTPHINDVGYLVELMCAVLWIYGDSQLVLCVVAENTASDRWVENGNPRRPHGPLSTRTFHMWLRKRAFRLFSFYSRSGSDIYPRIAYRARPLLTSNAGLGPMV